MMGAEPGRPNELSPITRIDTARVRPVQSAAGRSFIEPGSPWQNPFVESFGSRVRDEVLSVEAFDSVLEAQTVITDWRTIYNHRRPHSSLGWRPPAAYAASQTTNKSEKPARLSSRPDRQTGAGQELLRRSDARIRLVRRRSPHCP
jgi:putative transposase